MSLINVFRSRSGRNYVIFLECRHCGTKLEEGATECPTCGRTEIAQYKI